jgi:hypothetical protein
MSLQALRRWIARHPLSWVLGLALALGGAQVAATAHAYTHVAIVLIAAQATAPAIAPTERDFAPRLVLPYASRAPPAPSVLAA